VLSSSLDGGGIRSKLRPDDDDGGGGALGRGGGSDGGATRK
jgi:hypothetical protein